jgi:hypothetical protein
LDYFISGAHISEFTKTVTTVSFDNAKAREAEKAGTLPEGFTVERSVFLRIK